MKKLFIIFFLVLLIPSLSLAVEFVPTKLKLTVPETIQYEFDGSTLNIPVTVTGTAARTWLFVFTKGMAEDIVEVNNGYLGWHWVNQLDTCVYMSLPSDFGTGQQTITWNGKDSDGGVVPKGDDYTYYMWAFDYITPPEMNQACPRGIGFVNGPWNISLGHVQEKDEDGTPLARPFFMDFHRVGGFGDVTETWAMKWTIGQDPLNADLIETTDLAITNEWYNTGTGSQFAPNPYDFSTYYLAEGGKDYQGVRISKFTWVPNDLADRDPEWGYTSNECHSFIMAPLSDGDYLYWSKSHDDGSFPCSKDYIMDFDGEIVTSWQKDRWIKVEEYALYGITLNMGPLWNTIREGYIFQSTCFTLQGMIDPLRYLETSNYPDPEAWINQNGDFVMDRCTDPDSATPWCNGGESAPYATGLHSDANYFSVVNTTSLGATSVGLFAPDGTGVGQIVWAGEIGGWTYRKTFFVDNGSAYDGMYTLCAGTFQGEGGGGLGFIAHDSIKGTITSKVSVADEAPSAFAVEQNSPNPANPTTTISFTLPEAGTVTVDIFNVAGQKIDTLVNDFMDSGRHSVVWNGSNFSTGVYFYTVTAGEFSRTMKMTLLK